MVDYKPIPMLSKPGVIRDGTRLTNNSYSEMVWSRIYQGRPRKILGYREQVRNVGGIGRAIAVSTSGPASYVHIGSQNVLERYQIITSTGITSGIIDRTPVGFAASDDNNWQFSVIYDTAGAAQLIFAHAAPNIMDIADQTEAPVYYGKLEDSAALATTGQSVSGGVVAVVNYLIIYGNDGIVKWSNAGEPLNFSIGDAGDARPCANKIVRGWPLRGTNGSGSAPSALLFSLDSLVIMQWIGGTKIFDFTTVTTTASILSSNGIMEHNGIYYWATTAGFSMFNGVLRDLPNEFNTQWFLDNLNFPLRQKVFAFKVPRWNEIWWCAPMFGATECNWAVIYNYKENVWYDTPLPASGRSAAHFEQIYQYPVMTAATENSSGEYSAFQHEYGLDEISGTPPIPIAIRSSAQTHEFNSIVPEFGGKDQSLSYEVLEPDFDQVGDLLLDISSRYNARQRTPSVEPQILIPGGEYSPDEELTGLNVTARLTKFKVTSNEQGGNYVWGTPLLHVGPGDGRRQSG